MTNEMDIEDAARRVGVVLDAGQPFKLLAYAALLRTKGITAGVVSEADRERLVERHVIDSLRAATVLDATDRRGYDLGSGGGLPGVPIAIARPALHVTLVEPRRRRVAFLELVVQELDLPNLTVREARAEDIRDPADVAFARALAPVEQAWRLALPLLRPGGRLVFFAGRRAAIPASFPGASAVVEQRGDVLETAGPVVIITRQ